MKKKENTDLKKKVENGKIVSPVLPEGVKNYLMISMGLLVMISQRRT